MLLLVFALGLSLFGFFYSEQPFNNREKQKNIICDHGYRINQTEGNCIDDA